MYELALWSHAQRREVDIRIDRVALDASHPARQQHTDRRCRKWRRRGVAAHCASSWPVAGSRRPTVSPLARVSAEAGAPIRRTFQLTIAAGSPTNLTYTGTVTYTSGSGRFKHVRGGGTIACSTTDGGAHKQCNVTTTLTGI
ncbi:MAG: hypothetical protein QOJ89_1453 [bacterium]|jgi:hypothetical protein